MRYHMSRWPVRWVPDLGQTLGAQSGGSEDSLRIRTRYLIFDTQQFPDTPYMAYLPTLGWFWGSM